MPDPGPTSPPRRLFVVTPGFEAALAAELAGRPGLGPVLSPASHQPPTSGLVEADEAGPGAPPIDPVFARQQLPQATLIQAASVATLAEAAYALVESAVDRAEGPFTVHAFVPTGEGPALGSRATLMSRELLERLRERRRRASRAYRSPEAAAGTFGDMKLLIQILMIDRERAWVSAAPPRALPSGGWDLAPWPGGVAPVTEDRLPPSRAYRKLEEAFLWIGEEPAAGAVCVDLGGAPGGWSYTALRRGAYVIAVDRAPLQRPALGHPKLTMLEGNAFTYEPPGDRIPVDWLLSDVICEPARALALLRRWLAGDWCRSLVTTVKFKGQSEYGMLAEVRAALAQAGCRRARIKHLHHNKNEVTVMAKTAVSKAAKAPARRRAEEKTPRSR